MPKGNKIQKTYKAHKTYQVRAIWEYNGQQQSGGVLPG